MACGGGVCPEGPGFTPAVPWRPCGLGTRWAVLLRLLDRSMSPGSVDTAGEGEEKRPARPLRSGLGAGQLAGRVRRVVGAPRGVRWCPVRPCSVPSVVHAAPVLASILQL